MNRFLFISFLFICLHISAQLPDYHVQLFDESFGLRTTDVRKVVMDHKGFVWLMSFDRVQRFDGKHVVDYILEGSLQNMLCDRDNHIWVASYSKVYCLVNDKKGFVTLSLDTIPNLDIASITQFPGQEVWILTTNGYYVFDPVARSFSHYDDPVLSDLNYVHGKRSDVKFNTLFYPIEDSLVAYDPQTHERRVLPRPGENIHTVVALTEDMAFISLWKETLYLYDFAKGKIKEINLRDHLGDVQDYFITVYDAEPLGNERFLLATTKGMIIYNFQTGDFHKLTLFHKGKPLEGNLLFQDLFLDPLGTIWSAYTSYGLIAFRIQGSEIGLVRNYETDIHKAWDNHVRNFAEDENGNLWLSTFNGFACLDMQTGIIKPYFAKEGATDMINHPSIRGIVYDGTNLILGQTNRGIWLYNPKLKKYNRPAYQHGDAGDACRRKLEGSFTEQIYTLQNGDHVIAGSNAAYLMKGLTYEVSEIQLPGTSKNTDFTFQDSKKNIWIGTPGTVYNLDTNFVFRFKIDKARTGGGINCICEGYDGSIIAGGKGLYRILAEDTITTIEKIDPYFDKIDIHILYMAKENKLWLGTSEGLFRYDMLTKEIESFSNFENIEGNSFYQNSFCHSRQGLLFLGSTRGIIYFNPDQIGEEQDSLNIFITKFIVNDDDTSYSSTHLPTALKYNQNEVAFDFVAPFYRNANRLKYRYRLIGLNADWVNSGNDNTARFHSLRPGTYEFRSAASLNGINWFDSKEKILFSISPPFWNTWWFYVLSLLLLASGIYTLYLYQLNKKLEVEKLRMDIARDLHDDIGSALTNINIISSMALNKTADPGHSSKTFSKIKDSSKDILENMQDMVWAINPDHDSLDQAFSKMKEYAGELCENAGMKYGFEMDENLENIKLNVRKRKDLLLIFKEALNNAIKYSGAADINIRLFKKPNGWLVLEIRDNGKGFEQSSIHSGNGLKNMKARAKDMDGNIRIESGIGQGTIVEVQLPIT